MQPSGRAEFFWPRQLVRKWLQFKPTGDDFRADHHHLEHEAHESLVAGDGVREHWNEAAGKENSRDNLEYLPDLVIPERGDWRRSTRPLIRGRSEPLFPRSLVRGQSETLRKQYVENKEYRIAAGTWNVAGRPPPEDLDLLEEWFNDNQEADIYILGFQEIVPLNAGNVLCVEDEAPAAKWDSLIRRALNNRVASSFQATSQSAPSSPLRGASMCLAEVPEIDSVIEGIASDDKICSLIESEIPEFVISEVSQYDGSKYRSKKPHGYELTPDERSVPGRRTSLDGRVVSGDGRLTARHETGLKSEQTWRSKFPEEEFLASSQVVREGELLYDWSLKEAIPGPAEGFHSFLEQEESLQTPLVTPRVGDTQAFSRDSSQSKSRFSRIASKQMVGIFISVWVRTELRRHVHNVKVSCVGCGLMGYLGNKGSISVSMSLHQTSFCFTCSHLTSGHKEGDEIRRNSDVAEILRRTSFPRSSKILQLPETIMSHDCIIWLGDLNYRLALPDHEARSLVAREDWDALLEKDQLKIEQNAGHVFDGWEEGPICFAPTYKYSFNSDRYSGEIIKSGEKRRSPAWCDRILWLGKVLRQVSYIRTESRLSDHRPVSAIFIAEVENVSGEKLKRAVGFASPIPAVTEDISPHLSSLRSFRRAPLNEMKYSALPEQHPALSISDSNKLRRERSIGCKKVGEDIEMVDGGQHLLSVF